jgi:lactate racemase
MSSSTTPQTAHIAYGKGRIPLALDPALAEWHVVTPKPEPARADARAAFAEACGNPVGSPPLRDLVSPNDRVVIVTSDGTRPVPNRLLIPWLLAELPVPPEQATVIIGTGTHRPNTPAEIEAMFGEEVVRQVRIVNHDAYDPDQNEQVGTTPSGAPVALNKAYVNADKRIAVGFLEPHFFAGFSGGPKAIAPGIAAIDSILHLHSCELVANPQSTWGVLDGNPLHAAVSGMTALCPPDFLVNVALNNDKDITAFFVGHHTEAHRAGCAHVRHHAMAPLPHAFPIVVTSNSGYPLDQNLYQSVKGMSAAARIVEPCGTVFMASECSDGIPNHGNFGAILRQGGSPDGVEAMIQDLEEPRLDQWQAQVLAAVLKHCDVSLYSKLAPATVRACLLKPIDDLRAAVEARIKDLGTGLPIAVLPEGPVTIPYLA